MPVDTTDAEPWLHQRNPQGDIDPLYYYQRVCDWLSPAGPGTIPGGLLADGAYRMQTADGRCLLSPEREDGVDAPIVPGIPVEPWQSTVWLYHLGDGEYRILRLYAGRSLTMADGVLRQTHDGNTPAQRWRLIPEESGWRLQNVATGRMTDETWLLEAELTV